MNLASVSKQIGKWLLRIIIALLLLLLLAIVFIQTQTGKNFVKKQAVNYLQKKLGTRVAIDAIEVDWLTRLKLTGVYIEDREKKLLASIGLLETRYDVSNIFDNKLSIAEITLDNIQLNLNRKKNNPDFNFQFIANAFTTGDTEPTTASKPFNLTLGKLHIGNLQFIMNDAYAGGEYAVRVKSFKTFISYFDMATMQIRASYLYTDSINTSINLMGGTQPTAPTASAPTTDTSSFALQFTADTVQLANSNIVLHNNQTALHVNTQVQQLAGKKIIYQQQQLHAAAASLLLSGHRTAIQIKSTPINTNATTV
ncbi:MAG: hypothetical protein RL172_617, partial [Bacteroidota bacterium]